MECENREIRGRSNIWHVAPNWGEFPFASGKQILRENTWDGLFLLGAHGQIEST